MPNNEQSRRSSVQPRVLGEEMSEYIMRQVRDIPVETDWSLTSDDEPESSNDDDYEDDGESMPYDSVGCDSISRLDFAKHTFEDNWIVDERENVVNAFFRQMDYRLKWIFYREEKEGINRQRYIHPFSPEDFTSRSSKASATHKLNTETSKFYDWNIGGTDFVMRLESLNIKSIPCLRCHFIYKPNDKQICVQDRVWNGQIFKEINITWAEIK